MPLDADPEDRGGARARDGGEDGDDRGAGTRSGRWTRRRAFSSAWYGLLGLFVGLGLTPTCWAAAIAAADAARRDPWQKALVLLFVAVLLLILVSWRGVRSASRHTSSNHPVAPGAVAVGVGVGAALVAAIAFVVARSPGACLLMLAIGGLHARAAWVGGVEGLAQRFGGRIRGVGTVCADCGYDLSATPMHWPCSECGSEWRYEPKA
jgi:hypothetical protein